MRRFGITPGCLAPEARGRLASARVLVVGTGGVGGVVACELARVGIGTLRLVDFDHYTEGNLDRQIACYDDSLGKPKAEILAAEVARMGTVNRVEAIVEKRRAGGFAKEIDEADLVVGAADDYAFSLALMDRVLAAGKPAGAALPLGFWAGVGLFLPGGPGPAALLGLSPMPDEEGYAAEMGRWKSTLARFVRRRSGTPWTEALEAFAVAGGPPPQVCPVVWSAASLLVLEAVKLLSGFARSVVAPRWFEVTGRGIATRTSVAGILAAPVQASGPEGRD